MRPTLRQLQYFVALAETGRFGEAAKRLHVSQPSLSTQIADMEEELGSKLIERGRTGAILTPAGEDTLRRSREVLRQVEQMKASARQGGEGLTGQLRLGVLPSIGPYLLPNVTRQLHARYPSLLMSVREERAVDLEAQLRDGRLDTLIAAGEDHADMDGMPLFVEHLFACIAPDDPLARDDGDIDLPQLKGRDLLSLGYGHQLNATIQSLASLAEADVSAEYVGSSLDAIRQMAAMGAGVAILPSLYCLSETRRDPGLIVRRIAHPLAQRKVQLYWRASSPFAERKKLLGEILKTVAEDLLKDAPKL